MNGLPVGVPMAMVVARLVVPRTSLAWHARPLVSWSATGITLLVSAALCRYRGRSGGGVAKPGAV